MKRPTLCYREKACAKAAVEAIREAGVDAEPGSESDREKKIYTVYVEDPDQQTALAALDNDHLGRAIRCPACDSAAVEFPARARASGIFNAIEKLGDAVVPPSKHAFRCRKCENHWN